MGEGVGGKGDWGKGDGEKGTDLFWGKGGKRKGGKGDKGEKRGKGDRFIFRLTEINLSPLLSLCCLCCLCWFLCSGGVNLPSLFVILSRGQMNVLWVCCSGVVS